MASSVSTPTTDIETIKSNISGTFDSLREAITQYIEDYDPEIGDLYRKIKDTIVTKIEDNVTYFSYKGVQFKVVYIDEDEDEKEMLHIRLDYDVWEELSDINGLNLEGLQEVFNLSFKEINIKDLHPVIEVTRETLDKNYNSPFLMFSIDCNNDEENEPANITKFVYKLNDKKLMIRIHDVQGYKSGLFDDYIHDLYHFCNNNRSDHNIVEDKIDKVIKYFNYITSYDVNVPTLEE